MLRRPPPQAPPPGGAPPPPTMLPPPTPQAGASWALPPYLEAARYRKEITMSTATLTVPFTGYESLAQLRDDLKVRIHLGEMDARDQWQKLEPKWWALQRKVVAVEKASAGAVEEITAAADLLIEELLKGYGQIRKAL